MKKNLSLLSLLLLIFLITITGTGCAHKTTAPQETVEEAPIEASEPQDRMSRETALFSAENELIMYAHFIDVGQGNSTLLEFPCGAVLIDAGSQSNNHTQNLLAYLRDFFERRTDLNNTLNSVIITHNHVDHTRALREVVEAFTVLNFIENGQRGGYIEGDRDVNWIEENVNAGNLNITVLEVSQSDINGQGGHTNDIIDPIACSNIDPSITILSSDRSNDPGWDATGEEFQNKNNHSIVTRVDFGEASFLFTGDLEEPAIETLVAEYLGTNILDVDVYQVGHHGSYNGTTETLVQNMTPEIAVVSMGPWDDQALWTAWAYGHPRKQAIDLLKSGINRQRTPRLVHIATRPKTFYQEEMRDAIFATGWDGNIKIRGSSDGTFRVTTNN